MTILKEGLLSSSPNLLSMKAKIRSLSTTNLEVKESRSHGFEFVFVFPLPSAVTNEEEQAFRKRFLRCTGKEGTGHGSSHIRSYDDVISHAVLSPALREAAKLESCSSLSEARNCTTEMVCSFFESLGASLDAGIEMHKFTSEDCDELFVCVKVSDALASSLAEMGGYPLELKPDSLERLHIKLADKRNLVPAFVNCDMELSRHGWFAMYEKPEQSGEFSILRPVDRMRLLHNKITDYLDLHELQRTGLLKDMFPAHNKKSLVLLLESWANFRHMLSPAQPFDEIRDYFGEAVAFYFLFLGFLVKGLLWLLVPSLACSALWLLGYADAAQGIFCGCLVTWSTVLNKCWKRRQTYYSTKWGTNRHDAQMHIQDPINPRFHGKKRPSPVDENMLVLEPDRVKRLLGFSISLVISVLLTSLVIYGVAKNQMIAGKLAESGNKNASAIAAVLLSIQIQFWDKLWDYVLVDWLNDLEQHVTLYEADQSRVSKTFVIKFVNAFNAFFYMAYFQPWTDPEGCLGDCKNYLREQIFIVFMTYITFGFMDMILPYVTFKAAIWWETREMIKHGQEVFQMSFLEQQGKMAEYTGKDERADYLQVVLPLSFVMLFGTMMPTVVPLAYLALAFQIRTHAVKLIRSCRRPFPVRAGGIGVWDNILSVLSYLSILNAVGLLVAQLDDIGTTVPGFATLAQALEIPKNGPAAKVLYFFILQNTFMALKLAFDFAVSDITAATLIERTRQELQRVRIFDRRHNEFHEEIKLRGSTDLERSAFHLVPPLMPGHPMHVLPVS
mmetsp:Transcript_70387/g.228831  ORF Transcript_70387/g.228831 Transcript_70387/m.228831 type:complete len:784 (-) Transcript_70387:139-2490(-)|eukprot:CAMPEP_0203890408 /NCGR_PEP_ID=MMETSP0359-20131031/33832_1 /ASSEMBLY_ACC=CAM_ASM_000338 /TAXON_ID=268821 /ORGANISM="Scrippsiella Hangoei, Strain SHTV-5" /LENGTH=783 /DNA_ID=CAMNT_0050812025 /DNA_START=53 /DNA_END=2404 /DNA_ORIENTATION=+